MVVEVIGFQMYFESRTNTAKKDLSPSWSAASWNPKACISLLCFEVGLREQEWEALAGHLESQFCSLSLKPSVIWVYLPSLSVLHQILLCAPGPTFCSDQPTTICSQSLTPSSAKQDSSHPPRLNFATPSPTLGTPSFLIGDANSTLLHMCSPCSLKAL